MYSTNIEIFGKQIPVKNYLCTRCKNDYVQNELKLALYIKISDTCNASCKFCSNRNMKDNGKLDLIKLEEVIRHLNDNNHLHSINITGGEPMLNFELLKEIIILVSSINSNIKISFNTNGINFDKIVLLSEYKNLYNIHLSRHHYNDSVNNFIFGFESVSLNQVGEIQKELINKKLLVINCLLMKKYINSVSEVKKMLDEVSKRDISKVGFVTLMSFNEFARENYIYYKDLFSKFDNNFMFTNGYNNRDLCDCQDGIYVSNTGKLIEFYGRSTHDKQCDYAMQLVYTSDNRLTTGFNKPTIY